MLYNNRQKLADLTRKYLKFQSNVKSTNSNTYKSYATDLKQFINSIILFEKQNQTKSNYKNKDLAALHFALSRWRSLKPSSKNRKHACIKGFLKWLYLNKYILEPLDHHVICPKVPQKTPHFLSFDEVIALLKSEEKRYIESSAENRFTRQRNYCLILTIYSGALRVSEACGLMWINFKPEQKQIRVLGKGGRERIIVLPNKTVKALSLLEKHSEYIFAHSQKPLHSRTAYEIIRTAGHTAGLLKPLNPHALRHSLATHLLSGGMNLRTLQDYLGHKSLAATQKYTHLGIDQLAETLNNTHPLSKIKI